MTYPSNPPDLCPDLEDYLNREGSGEYRQHVENHLLHCANCQEIVRADHWLQGCLREANQAIEVPTSLQANIDHWKRPSTLPSISSRKIVFSNSSWLLAACVLACVTLAAFFLFRTRPIFEPTHSNERDIAAVLPENKPKNETNSPSPLNDGGSNDNANQSSRANSTQVQIQGDWLIANHPISDDQIEVYIVRPVLKPLAKIDPSQRGPRK